MEPRRLQIVAFLLCAMIFLRSRYDTAHAQDQSKSAHGSPLSADEAKKLKNPIPFSKKSISQGQVIFARNCTACHGEDGKALVDVVANATDLTSPRLFRDGTTEGEIFRSIRDGAGEGMPAYLTQMTKEEDLWNLVNFIRSLWPESMRPPLQDDKKTK